MDYLLIGVMMTTAVYVAMYTGILLFLAGCLARIYQYARTPFHLRWELYPVPHEDPSLAEHGGSYFESGEWWLHPQAIHRRGEWTTMFYEIAFLRGLWENNRRLWFPSFLFHSGLYLSIVTVILATLEAAARTLMPALVSGPLIIVAAAIYLWTGCAGAAFVLIGAFWLLVRRLRDPALKNYTKASDIFNLCFFLGTYGCLVAGFLLPGMPSTSLETLASGALTFNNGTPIGPVQAVGMILASALVAYIPFTHMSHFIAKYFTWHSVRWDDRRNVPGGALEKTIASSLQYRPTWAAPHVGADGKNTWAEITAASPVEEMHK